MEIISQLNRLYLGHQQRSKYLLQRKEAGYMTVDRSKGRHSPFLNDGHMKAHVEGRHTVGVFANYRNESSFLTFDVDFADDWERVKGVAYQLIDTIEGVGINRDFIYPNFSGNKGVHIDLFFDKPVDVNILKRFYWYVLHESGLSDLSNKIEFRPTQSQGIKIPLGYHQKTMRYCSFLDSDDLDNPLSNDFVERIEQLEAVAFVELVESLPTMTDIQKEASSIAPNKIESHEVGYNEGITAKSLENVFFDGFPAHGTRHNFTFQLALMFRDVYRYDKQTALDNLTAFIERHKATYTTPFDEALKDTKEIVSDIYDKENNYSFTSSDRKRVDLIDSDMWTIVTATDKEGKALTPARKKVLFALYIHWKRHDERENFFMTYHQMEEASGIKKRDNLKKAVDLLQEAGYIDIVRRNYKRDGVLKSEPNVYHLNFGIKKEGIPSGKRKSFKVEKLSSQSFNQTISKAFTKRQLRKAIPFNQVNILHG